MKTSQSGFAGEAPQSPIQSEFSALELAIVRLDNIATDLEIRLAKVLTPETEGQKEKLAQAKQLPMTSQIKNQLECNKIALDVVESKLADLLHRIEL